MTLALAIAVPVEGVEVSATPDLAFTVPGRVDAVAATANGGVIVGGQFDVAGERPHRSLARLDADGIPDPAWEVPCVPMFHRPCAFTTLAVADANWLIVHGEYRALGGVYSSGLLKVSQADAGVDPTWRPLVDLDSRYDVAVHNGYAYVAGPLAGVSTIRKIALAGSGAADGQFHPPAGLDLQLVEVAPDGRVYAAGFGAPPVRLDPITGAVDTSWTPESPDRTNSLAFDDSTGMAFAAGMDWDGAALKPVFVKLDPSSTDPVVSRWRPWTPFGYWATDAVPDDAGRVYLSGCDASSRCGIVIANAEGAGTVQPIDALPAAFGWLRPLAATSAGAYVTGDAATQDELVADGSSLFRIRPDGSTDSSYRSGVHAATAAYAAKRDSQQRMVVAGAFTRVAGIRRPGLVRLEAGGDIDPTFVPELPTGAYPWVIAIDADDDVYVGGAAPDGPLLRKLSAATGQDVGWTTPGSTAGPTSVTQLRIDPLNGSLYVATGASAFVCGVTSHGIVRADPEAPCAADPAWVPQLDQGVADFQVEPDAIYIGGGFTYVGDAPHRFLARIDRATALADADWNAALPGLNPRQIAVSGDALFVVENVLRKLRLVDGTAYPGWDPLPLPAAPPFYLGVVAAPTSPCIYVSSLGRVLRHSTVDGSVDPEWVVHTAGSAWYLEAGEDDVVIAGAFQRVAGVPRIALAAVATDAAFLSDSFE